MNNLITCSGKIYKNEVDDDSVYIHNSIMPFFKFIFKKTIYKSYDVFECNFLSFNDLYNISLIFPYMFHEYTFNIIIDPSTTCIEKYIVSYVDEINKKYNNNKLKIIQYEYTQKNMSIHVKLSKNNDVFDISPIKYRIFIEFIKKIKDINIINEARLLLIESFENNHLKERYIFDTVEICSLLLSTIKRDTVGVLGLCHFICIDFDVFEKIISLQEYISPTIVNAMTYYGDNIIMLYYNISNERDNRMQNIIKDEYIKYLKINGDKVITNIKKNIQLLCQKKEKYTYQFIQDLVLRQR